jgi:hypothetical protein
MNIFKFNMCVIIDGVWIVWTGLIDHLNTPLGTTFYRSLTHTDSWPPSITVSTSRFLATDLTQWRFFSLPPSGPLVTAASVERLSIDNSTNWIPGWRPFHTNLLVFSSQAHFQLTTDNWTLSSRLFNVTLLNWTAENSNQQLVASDCLAYNILARTT